MIKFIKTFYKTFDKHLCFTRTCALTFNTLLAIVPLFIILFEIVKRLPWFSQAYVQWQQIIIERLSIKSSRQVTDILNQIIEKHHHVPIITIVFLLITISLMIRSIEEALNDIFEVTRIKRRNFFFSLFIYISVIIITPCVLGLLIYMSKTLNIGNFTDQNNFLRETITIIIEVSLLYIFYTTLTSKKFPALYKWLISFIVIALIGILKELLILYITLIPTYRILYGALAGIPIFFLWIYLCWICFLGGAVLMQTIDILKNKKRVKDK